VRKTYRYRLYPTRAQGVALHGQVDEACRFYNAALQERRDAYRMAGESLTYDDQANQLKEIRAAEDLGIANFSACQDVLKRLDKACQAFFATLEGELLDRRRVPTQAEARMAVFDFIEGWYSPPRRHSGLDYASPISYEKRHTAVA
jgi:transposase